MANFLLFCSLINGLTRKFGFKKFKNGIKPEKPLLEQNWFKMGTPAISSYLNDFSRGLKIF